MSSNQKLMDSLTTRQIFIERYSKGEARRLLKHLQRLSNELQAHISTEYERVRAVQLARQVSRLTNAILTEYGADLTDGIKQFAKDEAEFAGQAIVAATSTNKFNMPSLRQIQAVLTKNPMKLIGGKETQSLTIDQAVKQFSKKKSREIAQLVRDGATVGRTSQEVARDINQLITTRTRQQAESLVRTATNHMGGQARSATFAANDDVIVGEEYTATLDGRTTVSCASLDGKVYPIGEGPQPPIHWACRSVRVPVVNPDYNVGADVTGERASIDGPVSAQTTYGGWLKRQGADVQDEVLGMERAKLFRGGKLSIGKFTDDTGKIYSLEELRRLNPIVFNQTA